jgi:hypothetical protein
MFRRFRIALEGTHDGPRWQIVGNMDAWRRSSAYIFLSDEHFDRIMRGQLGRKYGEQNQEADDDESDLTGSTTYEIIKTLMPKTA